MPVTLQFGPWAPDQSDTPIQIPDSQGPLPVPCADVLNVIYTNGNYRSINSPSIASINGNAIQQIGVQPVNAFSYFDEVAQQETVFAGTGVGVQQLNPDGSWSQVTLTTTQITALIGTSMSLKAGSFLNNTQFTGSQLKFAVGSLIPVVAGISFVAGNFFLSGGRTYTGYNNQGQAYVIPPFGTKLSANLVLGTFDALMDAPFGRSDFVIAAASDPTQGAFTTISSNGVTKTSASASYIYESGKATWEFASQFGFAAGSTYQVTLD